MNAVCPQLILAPIRGVTDANYRSVFARCFGGFDRAVAPFIHQLRTPPRPGDLRQLALEHNRDLAMVPQVLEHRPAAIVAVLRDLHRLGHTEVNWNLGCPFPTVARHGRGSGLLPHPDRIAAILDRVFDSCPVRLSVKLRLGYADPDEYVAVIDVLNAHPLSEVILHARTAEQMYEGGVDVERAQSALTLCRHPFVYNGDITTVRGFMERRERLHGVAGWMIGRGALACPFLPGRIKGTPLPAAEERRRRLRGFHDQLFEACRGWLSGPGHLLNKMKEQWRYLSLSFADPHRILARLCRSDSVERYTAIVDWVFDQPLADLERDGQ